MISEAGLRLEERDGVWALTGPAASRFGLVNEYLAYLADRNYSPKTVRAYGYDLLAFCRWLVAEEQPLAAVSTQVLLRFLRACREATVPGRPGPNVVRLSGRRADQYAGRRSTGGSPRSRGCSRSSRCVIPMPAIPSRRVARPAGGAR